RTIAIWGGMLLVLTVVAMMIVGGILTTLETRRAVEEPRPSLVDPERFPPPAPRLQPNPIDQTTAGQELEMLRAKEEGLLNSYGWVDREAGTVRIPIEEAMKLVVAENQ
ncbi:hypothetical protein ACFLXQ_08160, partial [Chloroflexota bacterium]